MAFLTRHYFFIPQIVALAIGYLAWIAFDRTPPLILYNGKITPTTVYRDQHDVVVTWRARYAGRDCPGLTQRELIDSGRHIWPELKRSRAGIFKPDSDDALMGNVTTPPLSIPNMLPGPAEYRVTQFYYCNWLQRLLNWPIVEVSPFIRLEVAP